ncbi:MAG: P-loop NTPase [Candidatus Aenigmarchaeota archaeon]|nr:P-loop NTPase [Candidatus Aenigmarchaeota archaeon]MCK4531709.1 P-loop NTPase [Candidatus Aenigmarchaeota archaeon]
MKRIAITGGKGGTGKSTFAVLLAYKLLKEGKKVVLCDADVECPNDHLILGKGLEFPEPVYQKIPVIDPGECRKCGLCVRECRFNALFQLPGKPPSVVENLCCGCGLCWTICPHGAISKRNKECGKSYETRIEKDFWLVTGLSSAGVEETGPIVRDTKIRAEEVAKKVGADYLLVDTAAGTHCDVINALMRNEKAYVVTEPTILGEHDSELILKLLDVIGIPKEIVLNKAGVASKKGVEKVAEKFETKISFEIPYSEELVKAYCRGNLRGLDLL